MPWSRDPDSQMGVPSTTTAAAPQTNIPAARTTSMNNIDINANSVAQNTAQHPNIPGARY